jgi:hypothetical protein
VRARKRAASRLRAISSSFNSASCSSTFFVMRNDHMAGKGIDTKSRAIELQAEHNHYSCIGRVAAAWSYLEAVVDTSSIGLAGLATEPGICFTSQISGIGRKLDAYIALARLRNLPQELVQKLDALAKAAQGLGERRNRIVHDVWFFDHPNDPRRLEATARRLVRLEYIPTSSTKLTRFAYEISKFTDEFDSLNSRVVAAPIPSAEKLSTEPQR